MGYLSAKVAYLKGLCDGLELDKNTKEGKILSAMIEVLDEMAVEVEESALTQDEMQNQLDEIDEALSDLEEEVDAISDDLSDIEDVFDGLDDLDDDFDDDFEDEDEDWEEEYSFECPKCGDLVYVDPTLLEGDEKQIVCPNCHEPIELEFDCDTDEE